MLACYQKSLGPLFGTIVPTLFQSLGLSHNTQGKTSFCPPLILYFFLISCPVLNQNDKFKSFCIPKISVSL